MRPAGLVGRIRLTVISIAVLLFAVSGCSDSTGPGSSPNPPGQLWVLNQGDGTLYIYNTETLERTDSVDLGVSSPHYIEFSPDGQFYYIVSLTTSGVLAKFRASDHTLLMSTTTPSGVLPSSIAVTADGAFGYVSNFSGDDLASRSRILKYDLATMTIVGDVLGGAVTHDLKISDDGGLVVASNRMTNDVTVVHTDADTIAIVPIDPDSLYEAGRKKYGPLGILIDSERDRAFVACVDAFQIRILSLSERRIIDSINIPVVPLNMEQAISGPTLMAYDPATDHLFVTTQNGNSVVSVHVSDRTVVADIPTFIRQSFGIAVSGDGSRVYAVCVNPVGQQGRVYVIDNSVNPPVLTDSLDVGKKSYGLVWRPE